MAQKVNLNFNVHPELKKIFQKLASPYGFHQKWALCSSAIMLLYEYAPGEVEEMVAEMVGSDVSEDLMTAAVVSAKKGEWRRRRELSPPDIKGELEQLISRRDVSDVLQLVNEELLRQLEKALQGEFSRRRKLKNKESQDLHDKAKKLHDDLNKGDKPPGGKKGKGGDEKSSKD